MSITRPPERDLLLQSTNSIAGLLNEKAFDGEGVLQVSNDYTAYTENRDRKIDMASCGANFCSRMKYGLYGNAFGLVAGAAVTASMAGGAILGASLGVSYGGPAGAFIGGIVGSSIAGAISGAIVGAIAGACYKDWRFALGGAAAGFVLGGAAGALYAWGGLFAGPAMMGSVSMAAVKTTIFAAVGTGLGGALFGFFFPPKPPRPIVVATEYDRTVGRTAT